MPPTTFRRTSQLGDSYWLYVVWDPLGTPDSLPLIIRNPVKHLDHAKREVFAARFYLIPAEAINQKNLSAVLDDKTVQETLDRHHLSHSIDSVPSYDEIDDDELNEILWLAIRGTEPPAPVRSYFAR